MTVSGRGHPRIRALRRLRSDRAERDGEGLFLAEGLHLAHEALASGAKLMSCGHPDPW